MCDGTVGDVHGWGVRYDYGQRMCRAPFRARVPIVFNDVLQSRLPVQLYDTTATKMSLCEYNILYVPARPRLLLRYEEFHTVNLYPP